MMVDEIFIVMFSFHLHFILISSIPLTNGQSSSASSSSAAAEFMFFGSNSSIPIMSMRSLNKVDNDACERIGVDCSKRGFGYYCCRMSDFAGVQCCSTNNIQPVFSKPSGDPHWLHRFSLWNMWYFWFIVVLILATCFTGCNYWRRQRRSQHFRLFQRQYTTISGRHNNETVGGPQIVIPITMYEVSPDTILRLMRENASYHTTASTLSSSSGYGSPRFHGQHHHSNRHGDHDRNLHQGPPSYGEVTSKPNMYPPKADDTEPPSYESVSQSVHREPAPGLDQEDEGVQGDQSSQPRRLSL